MSSSNQTGNFNDDMIKYFFEAREKGLNRNEDFAKQQGLYTKYANSYDENTTSREYNAPNFAATKVKQLYPNQKDIKILDYGCGTGQTADCLSEYTNIDGLDPCKELLDVARLKGRMKNLFELGSDDDDSAIQSNEYDVICSSGVFYASPSHPGFECFPKISRYVKSGGYIIICTGNKYLENVKEEGNKILEDLVSQGKLRMEPKVVLENYKKPMHAVEGEESIQAALLVYQVL